jgi:tRNA (cmo5U34)-methyltransferase
MTWDPDTYPSTIRAEIHDYETLQEEVVKATSGLAVRSILELGVGAGETATRLLREHPEAHLVGIDSSAEMLRGAGPALPSERVTLVQQDLQAPFSDQRFELVVSALAIHHLEGDLKADLFQRIAGVLVPGGRFVMGDVVTPKDPDDVLIENEPGYDFPSTVSDQRKWLSQAGFQIQTTWVCKDLAVFKAELQI